MKYELIFLDVDGTLKQEPYKISETNKEAIRLACKMGKKVSIASGRNRDMILRTVKELGLDEAGESYTVALNGAHIIENSTGKTLHAEPIEVEHTRFLFGKAYELGITSHVYTENYVYFNYQDFQYDWYQNEGCDCRLIDMDKPDLGMEEIPLKFFLLSKEWDKLESFRAQARTYAEDMLNAEFSSKYTLEYTSKKASKGLGMEYICRLYGLPLTSAIAMGDGENDISMLKMAGLGIAMNNALESVKSAADAITLHTCKENAVSDIIRHYLLA